MTNAWRCCRGAKPALDELDELDDELLDLPLVFFAAFLTNEESLIAPPKESSSSESTASTMRVAFFFLVFLRRDIVDWIFLLFLTNIPILELRIDLTLRWVRKWNLLLEQHLKHWTLELQNNIYFSQHFTGSSHRNNRTGKWVIRLHVKLKVIRLQVELKVMKRDKHLQLNWTKKISTICRLRTK